MKRVLLLGLALSACAGNENANSSSDTEMASSVPAGADSALFHQFVDPSELPPMPAYPQARRGKLTLASSGPIDLTGEVDAQASICANPSMLMLQASADNAWGYLLLLQVPFEGERATIYPVKHVDAGFPEPPASMVGVQRVTADAGTALQGLQGFAEVTEFGERITGTFQITVRDIVSEDLVQLVASFEDIEVHEETPERCLPAAAIGG